MNAPLFATLGAVLLVLLSAIVIDIVSSDVRGWLRHVSCWLVNRTTRHLPPEGGLAEEMEAELAEYRDRPLTTLVVAIRIWRDRKTIAAEATRAAMLRRSVPPTHQIDSTDYNVWGPWAHFRQIVAYAFYELEMEAPEKYLYCMPDLISHPYGDIPQPMLSLLRLPDPVSTSRIERKFATRGITVVWLDEW